MKLISERNDMLMQKNHRTLRFYKVVKRSVYLLISLMIGLFSQELLSMVEDNRFFPEYPRNYSRTWERPSAAFFDGMIMVGHEAFDQDDENDIGLFDIFGLYDENKVANALIVIGQPDPFNLFPTLARFRNQNVIWNMEAKIQTQGGAFQWDQHIWRNLWMGGSFFFMHLYSRNAFELNGVSISQLAISVDDQVRLDELRRYMNQQLGLSASVFNTTGFSDIDFYLRVGNIWDYLYKFRRIDAGLKVGIMFPTGLTRKITNPASLPFGGDGHWGVYSALDMEFELKEDWKAGLHARANKRFAKTKTERMSVAGEQQLYGAVQGPALIDPGFTFIVSPYARLENIREGFGLQIGYIIAHHLKDKWTDERIDKTPPVDLEPNRDKSKWTAEFVTVDAFFDCTHILCAHWSVPIVSFKWDVPVKFFAAQGAAKTNRIMLGVELNF